MRFHDEFGNIFEKPAGIEIKWRPSVRGLVIHDSKLLCVRPRSHGKWEIPGGAIDIGETPEQALLREVLEETGYSVRSRKAHPVHLGSEFFYCDGTYWQSLSVVFLCSVLSPEAVEKPDPEMEIAEVRWVPFSELASHGLNEQIIAIVKKSAADTRSVKKHSGEAG